MGTTTVINPEAMSLLREGWTLLVDQLGIRKATQFVMLLERRQGDSVEEIAQYWGDKSIEEIRRQVMSWKSSTHKKPCLVARKPANNADEGIVTIGRFPNWTVCHRPEAANKPQPQRGVLS